MDAKLIELTICAQKGDMEAFSNLIISFEQEREKGIYYIYIPNVII